MTNEMPESMLKVSSFLELGRMIKNIDRFDTDVPNDLKVSAENAIVKAEELTNQIVEENL